MFGVEQVDEVVGIIGTVKLDAVTREGRGRDDGDRE